MSFDKLQDKGTGAPASRFRRQVETLLALAWPATISRLGVIFMAVVDTLMVGRFATNELAYLNLGNGTIVMVVLVASIGLMIGTLVHTANAHGRNDYAGAGQVWRRSMPYSLMVGIGAMIICQPGEIMFLAAGQSDELAHEGARVMSVLGFGLVGYIIYVNCVFFLEGIERPKPGMYMVLAANLLNVGFNYVLIYGAFGFPSMGAEGSAWATTILRLGLAVTIILYILFAPALRKYETNQPNRSKWSEWRKQRHLGYGAGVALGAEVTAFGMLAIFAGWIGLVALASWGIVMNVMSVVFMLAAGMGVAASVRVGIARARNDYADAALAGWTAVLLGGILLGVGGAILFFGSESLARAYSTDTAVLLMSAPLIAYASVVMLLDGEQAVLANALRGLGEAWVPMFIQSFAYLVVMIPVSYWLAIMLGGGVRGMLEGVIIAGAVSAGLQGVRFYWMTHVRPKRRSARISGE
jgi:MATE family, multidrug efflux pump